MIIAINQLFKLIFPHTDHKHPIMRDVMEMTVYFTCYIFIDRELKKNTENSRLNI